MVMQKLTSKNFNWAVSLPYLSSAKLAKKVLDQSQEQQ